MIKSTSDKLEKTFNKRNRCLYLLEIPIVAESVKINVSTIPLKSWKGIVKSLLFMGVCLLLMKKYIVGTPLNSTILILMELINIVIIIGTLHYYEQYQILLSIVKEKKVHQTIVDRSISYTLYPLLLGLIIGSIITAMIALPFGWQIKVAGLFIASIHVFAMWLYRKKQHAFHLCTELIGAAYKNDQEK